MTSPKPSSLLSLPAELRLRVYDYLFDQEINVHIFATGGNLYKPTWDSHIAVQSRRIYPWSTRQFNRYPLALLRVCKQIRNDVHDLVHNSMRVVYYFSWVRARKTLGRNLGQVKQCAFIQRIKHLQLDLDLWTPEPPARGDPYGEDVCFHGLAPVINALEEMPELEVLDLRIVDDTDPVAWYGVSDRCWRLLFAAEKKLARKGVRVVWD